MTVLYGSHMAAIEPERQIGAARLDIAVDIQPFSRHDEELPDVATIINTLVLTGGRVLQLIEQRPLFENEEGDYQVRLQVPPAWIDLAKGATWQVIALLPRDTDEWTTDDVRATAELDEMASVDIDVIELPGGREAAVARGDKDDLDLLWKYLRT